MLPLKQLLARWDTQTEVVSVSTYAPAGHGPPAHLRANDSSTGASVWDVLSSGSRGHLCGYKSPPALLVLLATPPTPPHRPASGLIPRPRRKRTDAASALGPGLPAAPSLPSTQARAASASAWGS